jgi:hypothetical protein
MKTKIVSNLLFIGLLFSQLSLFAQTSSSDSIPKIRVYYFHATNRCETCLACEHVCFEILEQEFNSEIEKGTIFYKAINIDEEQNKALVAQYKIMFSTLLFIDQKGNITDLSDKAFENALEHPDVYKNLIRNEVLRLLND